MSAEPSKLHLILGVLTWLVVVAMAIAGGTPWYARQPHILTILGIIFLMLIGLGVYVEIWLKNR